VVVPGEPLFEQRVKIARDRTGRLVGFQDPDAGYKFIQREEAIVRLRLDVESGQILDSFGNPVGVGGLHYPAAGYDVATVRKLSQYRPLDVPVEQFKPGPNQELIERNVFVTAEGKLVTDTFSYGRGVEYREGIAGGRWRWKASEALGLEPHERLSTRDLKRSVLLREFLVKTVT